jgi:hypothetical protein
VDALALGDPISPVYAAKPGEIQSVYNELKQLMKPEEIGSWLLTEMEEFENRTPAPKAFGAGRFNQQKRDRPALGVVVLFKIGNAGLNLIITLSRRSIASPDSQQIPSLWFLI